MTFFAPGVPKIALLDSSGAKVKTLNLPMPDAGYPTVEWAEKSFHTDLIDGSESDRRLGWVPVVVFHWSVYDDRPGEGWVIGALDGNRPGANDLLTLLDAAPGMLKLSLGPAGPGMVAQSWTHSPIGVETLGFAKDLTITFRGKGIYSAKTLGAF